MVPIKCKGYHNTMHRYCLLIINDRKLKYPDFNQWPVLHQLWLIGGNWHMPYVKHTKPFPTQVNNI